jgi:hypothetical protein
MTRKSTPPIADLQAECEKLGLPWKGLLKKELQDLLKAHQKQKKTESVDVPELFKESSLPRSKVAFDSAITFEEKKLGPNEFLFQLDVANLLMYLVAGVFYPLNLEKNEVYKTENRRKDTQSLHDMHLVLSKGLVQEMDDTQVLVRLVLKDEEIQSLMHGESYSLLAAALPVSRMLCVYFNSTIAINRTQSSINSFSDTYLEKNICRLVPPFLEKPISIKHLLFDISATVLTDWENRLMRYDKLMGMFSYLKNSALFYTNQTGEFLEYPASYFECLGLINTHFHAQAKNTSFFAWIIFPNQINIDKRSQRFYFQKMLEAIYNNVIFSSQWAISLLKEAAQHEFSDTSVDEISELKTIFAAYETQRVDYKQLLTHPRIRKNIPLTILVFLVRFCNKNITHSDKQAVRHYFTENATSLEKNTAEYTLAVLGLYYGYTLLPKYEQFHLDDKFFQSLLGPEATASMKFRLDNMLDRFVIESVFEFAMTGQRVADVFPFLHQAANDIYPDTAQRKPSVPPGYVDKSYSQLEKYVYWYTKLKVQERKMPDLFSTYGTAINWTSVLFHYAMHNNPNLLQIDTMKFNRWIASLDETKIAEIIDCIELDKKRKKTSG